MDSPEYKTLTKCYPSLVSCVQQSPSGVEVQLRPYGVLAPTDLTFLNNPTNDDDKKAKKIIDAVLLQVQNNPKQFISFIKALRAAGDWTGATPCHLERTCAALSDQYSNYDEIDELDISKLPAELQALELDLENLKATFSKTESISILVTGKTGSGKSALTNGILGFKVRGEGPAQEGSDLEACTQEVKMYVTRKGKIRVTVWDSPGLQDGTKNQEEYLRQMKEKCYERDLTIYCINISETKFSLGDENPHVVAMKKLTITFGNEFWNSTIIVLTFANFLEAINNVDWGDLSSADKAKACMKKIFQWKKRIQEILSISIQVPNHIVRAIRIVPAGHYTKPHLPGYPFWLSALWMHCVDMMSIHEVKVVRHKFEVPTLDTYEDEIAKLPHAEPRSLRIKPTDDRAKPKSQAKASTHTNTASKQHKATPDPQVKESEDVLLVVPKLDTYESETDKLPHVKPSVKPSRAEPLTISQAKSSKEVTSSQRNGDTQQTEDKYAMLRESAQTLSPKSRRADQNTIQKLESGSFSKSVSILMTGKTGSGKSTLTNGILGLKVDQAEESGSVMSRCTTVVKKYESKINGIDVIVWDSPGLQDGTDDQSEYLQEMKTHCSNVDLTMYCIKAIEKRFVQGSDNPDVVAMKKLTQVFGHNFWKNTIVVLTCANMLEAFNVEWEDLPDDEKAKEFRAKIQEWEEQIKDILIEDIKVPAEIANAVKVVPAGHYKKPKLPGYSYWLSNLWYECIQTIPTKGGCLALVKINEKHMKGEDDVTKADFKKALENQPIIVTKSNMAIGGAGGFAAGAGTGAAVGSLVAGPIGTAVGAGIGALVGAIFGGGASK